jgi:hypothetical protein
VLILYRSNLTLLSKHCASLVPLDSPASLPWPSGGSTSCRCFSICCALFVSQANRRHPHPPGQSSRSRQTVTFAPTCACRRQAATTSRSIQAISFSLSSPPTIESPTYYIAVASNATTPYIESASPAARNIPLCRSGLKRVRCNVAGARLAR